MTTTLDTPPPSPPAGTGASDSFARMWPARRARLGNATAGLALLAGVLAAMLPQVVPGIGLALVAALLVGAAASAARKPCAAPADTQRSVPRVPWRLAVPVAWLLVVVVALRDAGWFVALSVLAGAFVGCAALSRGRSMTALVLGGLSLPAAGCLLPGWLGERAAAFSGSARRLAAAVRGTAIAVLAVLVFVSLFASADAAFSGIVQALVPDVDLASLPARLTVLVLVALLALAVARLGAGPPTWDAVTPGPGRPRAAAEWFPPVLALDAVFLAFVGTQVTVLVRPGGRSRAHRPDLR